MTRRLRTHLLILGVPVILSMMILARGCDDGHMRHVFAATKAETEATYRVSGGIAIPDAGVTPGVVDRDVEADLSGKSWVVDGLEKNICAPHFSASAIRKRISDFPRLKREACAEYGVKKCDKHVEGDHLISIELGGCPDCIQNLWPQPMADALIKDHQVEDALPKLICSGRISLEDAQKCIATDWVKCADRVKRLQAGK